MDSLFFFHRCNLIRKLGIAFLFAAITSHSFSQLPDYSRIVENITPAVVSITVIAENDPEHASQLEPVPTSLELFELSSVISEQIQSGHHIHNGTGVIISEDGYIVTNQHVIQNGIAYLVTLANGFQYPAQLINSDTPSDLAVLKIQADNLTVGVFSENENNIKAGQSVLGFGSPYSLSGSVTQGIISYVNRPLPIMGINGDYIVFIQTNLLINPGNSGGPVVNQNGEIIGINSLLLSDTGNSSGVAFAIPAAVVKNITEQLICCRYASRGWIGATVENIPPIAAIPLGLATPKGALVTAIIEGSPAEEAGIKMNDVIVAVNHNVINNRFDLSYRIGLLNSRQRAHLIIIRDKKYHSTAVTPRELILENF